MNENELSKIIIGIAINVHDVLGLGVFESVYEKALAYELKKNGLRVETQKKITITYKDLIIDDGFRVDIIVNDLIILELKSVKKIEDIHTKQLLTYLKFCNKKLGLLINFNEMYLKDGLKRVINGTI